MAIVQISRITHRKGLAENLPQLAGAELGWVLDERRLFIGNGSLQEGAPIVGNTEILTEHTDLANAISNYTYKGEAAGYTAQTGANITTPTTRTLQRKLDDFVNVRDFGAVGDGATDDTDAINRAIQQLYLREINVQIRRVLYFPAGQYNYTSGSLKLPPFCSFVGEGPDSTSIQHTDSGAECVVRTSDSLGQVYPNIGTNGAEVPNHISVVGMNFVTTSDKHIAIIDNAYDVRFQNCKFIGNNTNPTTGGTSKACVLMRSNPVNDTHTIVFEQCEFEEHSYGIIIDDDIQHVVINSSTFDTLHKGLKLGEFATGTGPAGVKVTGSYFDNIYFHGLHVYTVGKNISSFNTYRNVGNGFVGASNPISPVIEFDADDNYSIGDNFDRNDTDDMIFARVEFNGFFCFSVESDNWIKHGRLKTLPGNKATLGDNAPTPQAITDILLHVGDGQSATIEYTLIRGSNVRRGELFVALDGSNVAVSDDFVENNSSTGVTFSADIVSGNVRLLYVTTSTGTDAEFRYNIRLLGA